MFLKPVKTFAQMGGLEQQQKEEPRFQPIVASTVTPNMPYPQPPFPGRQYQTQATELQPVWFNANSPPRDFDDLRDERGRPLTTWSLIDNCVQSQEQSARADGPIYAPSSTQRSVTDPTKGTYDRQLNLRNPQAEQAGRLRRRAKINWQPFGRGRKHKQTRPPQIPIDMIHNANLRDPALERNQPTPFSSGSQSSEAMVPRGSQHTRHATPHSQQNALTAPHMSIATTRTEVKDQSEHVQPARNDALLMGSGPMIPTRDGNCGSLICSP